MRLKYKKGLSLLEILIITAILSVISAIAYTSYGRYIRQSRQIEAKTHLALAYQAQHSYFTEHSEFSYSLKNLGVIPRGQIRYNIGTRFTKGRSEKIVPTYADPDYESALVHKNNSESICPCGNQPPSGKNCWAHPQPESENDISHCATGNKCFGPVDQGDIVKQVEDLNIDPPGTPSTDSVVQVGEIASSGGIKFMFYAIGCTTSAEEYLKPENLDVWSINHKRSLRNLKNGT